MKNDKAGLSDIMISALDDKRKKLEEDRDNYDFSTGID
jgi:DNA-binding protein YbaB